MPLPLELIERFFTATFQPVFPGPGQELNHFDGFAHWEVMVHYLDDQEMIHISADRDEAQSAFPVVELAVYCSRISATEIVSEGPVLYLQPNDTEEQTRTVVLTKTRTGRISLSMTVGRLPTD